MAGKSSPILVDGRIYQSDDQNNLYIVDAATGKPVTASHQADRRNRPRQPAVCRRQNLSLLDHGLALLPPDGQGSRGRAEVAACRRKTKCPPRWSCRTGGFIWPPMPGSIAWARKIRSRQPRRFPRSRAEPAVADDDTPAEVQVVPAELLMTSGRRTAIPRAAVQQPRPIPPRRADRRRSRSMAPGKSTNRACTKPPTTTSIRPRPHAKVGDLKGQARIRVVPPLPWKFDFQKIPLVDHPKSARRNTASRRSLGSAQPSQRDPRRSTAAK